MERYYKSKEKLEQIASDIIYADLQPKDYKRLTEGANAAQLFRFMQLSLEYQIKVNKVLESKEISKLKKEIKALKKQATPYRCPYCPSFLTTEADSLKRHLESQHLPQQKSQPIPPPIAPLDTDALVNEIKTVIEGQVSHATAVVQEDLKTIGETLKLIMKWNPDNHDITVMLDGGLSTLNKQTRDIQDSVDEAQGKIDQILRRLDVPKPSTPPPPVPVIDKVTTPKKESIHALERERKYPWIRDMDMVKSRYPPPSNEMIRRKMDSLVASVRLAVEKGYDVSKLMEEAKRATLSKFEVDSAVDRLTAESEANKALKRAASMSTHGAFPSRPQQPPQQQGRPQSVRTPGSKQAHFGDVHYYQDKPIDIEGQDRQSATSQSGRDRASSFDPTNTSSSSSPSSNQDPASGYFAGSYGGLHSPDSAYYDQGGQYSPVASEGGISSYSYKG